jgi:hypothetical protein
MNPTSKSFVPNVNGTNVPTLAPKMKKKKESGENSDSILRRLRNFVEVSGVPLESTEEDVGPCSFQSFGY